MSEQHFVLPDVGEGLTEAEIVTWKVTVGDTVTLNQPLVDIETAKATVELPSPYAGVVTKLHAQPGDVVDVGGQLIDIEVAGTAPAADSAGAEPPPSTGREAVLVGYGVATDEAPTRTRRRRGAPVGPDSTPPDSTPPDSTPPAASPAATARPAVSPRSTPPVRLYAKQHGVDLARVVGTGRDGLVTRADVEAAAAGGAPTGRPIAPPATGSRFVGHDLAPWATGPKEERIPVRGVLRSMAEAMVKSAFTAPHAAAWVRVDATGTMELLAALRDRPSLAGVRLSPLTIVALALCDAARHYPGINSSFDDAAGEVVIRRSIGLGIAADTPRGLVVPNVKGADQLDLFAMAREINALVERARAGTSTPAEMLGTTLTITNIGPYGIDGAMPILPPTTSFILAVGRVQKAPWVVDDQVVVRQVVEIAASFDHRLIDGALASRVLAHVGSFLTEPAAAIIAG